MFLGLTFIIGGLGLLMILERFFPDRNLPRIPGWWIRVLAINISQLVIVVVGAFSWENFFLLSGLSIMNLKDYVNPCVGGFIAYLVNTWIFYWFHRARHDIYAFWILFHQVHHSPQRIESITSFYKHPLEISVDSVLMTILLYPILGLHQDSSIWLSIFSAYGEYFYHMNIKTPHWIGYFFQRPESHRVHHVHNKRENCKNYSDCPLWDILGNTFHNPIQDTVQTGFSTENELRFTEMLLFRDVLENPIKNTLDNAKNSKRSKIIKNKRRPEIGLNFTNLLSFCLLMIGLLQPIGYLFNQADIRGLGIVSAASPLPLVFTAYNGSETFTTYFVVDLHLTPISDISKCSINPTTNVMCQKVSFNMTKEIYNRIDGPYNRRNVFGVLFSYGPFFTNPSLIKLRDNLLDYTICKDKLRIQDYLSTTDLTPFIDFVNYKVHSATINVKSKSQEGDWFMKIKC